MIISMIYACSDNGIIGAGNTIPWNAKEEQRRFKVATQYKMLLMGRKTYESLPSKLANRKLIVITSQPLMVEDVMTVSSLKEGIDLAREKNVKELVIAGGAGVYQDAMPFCDVIYSSVVHITAEGDTSAPNIPTTLFEKRWTRTITSSLPYFTYDTWLRNSLGARALSHDFGLLI